MKVLRHHQHSTVLVGGFISKRPSMDPNTHRSCANGAWSVSDAASSSLWRNFYLQLVPDSRIRTSRSQTATIYLGAAATITGGLLTYFKSRNQPNRARQLRQALRSVRNNMDDQFHKLAGLTPEEARAAAQEIIKQYHNALNDAAANYPDLWVTLKDNSKRDRPEIKLSDAGPKPDEHGTHAETSPMEPPEQHESRTGSSETQAELGNRSLPGNSATSIH
jgi:hypothetical protein